MKVEGCLEYIINIFATPYQLTENLVLVEVIVFEHCFAEEAINNMVAGGR
jgi:hypothetical protein